MTNLERAVAAYRAMPNEYQREVLPILELTAKSCRRRATLHLVVSNDGKGLLGRTSSRTVDKILPTLGR